MRKVKIGQTLVVVILAIIALPNFCHASPPGGRVYPKANEEATEKLKEAYAAYHQGWYDQAIELAMEVYRKYGDVHARWWPTWVKRLMKGNLPDPHDRGAILRAMIEGKAPLTMMVKGVTTGVVLERAYIGLGYYNVLGLGSHVESLIKSVKGAQARGYRPPQLPPTQLPPKNTWRPLPLRFREEDYFILVPLDEACKVLGLSFRYKVNQKTGKKTGAQIGEKGLISLMGRPFARNIRGEIDDMAYTPFEENGVVWVPFYWLAKQVGIRGWEVRDGKIYVAPK